FLYNQIMDDGRFVYGYFPAYDREIKSYNTVRHCTSLYALLETLEVDFNQKYLDKIEKSMEYAFEKFYKIVEEKGFMIDGEKDLEIKLGSNATAIFMIAKYQEITGKD
ncbi:poly alpha-glucosyltransferase, partial [Acinetobacter baumannii]|nr:poly alpha-glucosyltransferase [Acinetobacter baumannii]